MDRHDDSNFASEFLPASGPGCADEESAQTVQEAVLRQRLFILLISVDSFDKAEVRAAIGDGFSDQQFGLLLHDVRERLRKEFSVEFIVSNGSRKRPGFYVRATELQKLNRSRQFSRTAKVKVGRAYDVVKAVDEDGLDPDRRDTLRNTRERIAREVVRAHADSRSPMPDGCDIPEVPRRDR